MLLDTSFLIDLMRGDEGAVAKAREIEEDLVQQRVASMTLFELFFGVARSDQPERERRIVEEVVSSKPIESADGTVMRRAGRRSGELASDGETIPDGDVIIGATAESVGEPVLTRNVDHFQRLDVPVETY